jgi:hypothetical protein
MQLTPLAAAAAAVEGQHAHIQPVVQAAQQLESRVACQQKDGWPLHNEDCKKQY